MIEALAQEFWEERLRMYPTLATRLGDRRYDDRMRDMSPEGVAAEQARIEDLERRVTAVDPAPLAPSQRITQATLLGELRRSLALYRTRLWEWDIDPMHGVHLGLMSLARVQTVHSPEQGSAMVSRWRAMGAYVDGHTAALRRALGQGRVATRDVTLRVVRQLGEILAGPIEKWPLLAPLGQPHPDWSEAERSAFGRDLREAVEDSVRPALVRYLDCIRDEVLPRSRAQDRAGLGFVPGGEEAYQAMIGLHTSLDLGAKEIHDLGLTEVRRLCEELREIGSRVLDDTELERLQQRLRSDPGLFFATREEVLGCAEEAMRRAEAAVPRWFGRLPKARCEVRPIEPHEEKDASVAYYRPPAKDGSRPGVYWINTYAPETRPRFEAQATAYHEAIPGHHLQGAIAQEQDGLPEFRKHINPTAYSEGWALYCERLADEMGLYSGDLDRIGMISFDAERACRLVVDTGLHAFGWSRQRAIEFMLENTALGPNRVEIEVDRYIAWPGQALAYKLGQRELVRLRRTAEDRLGARFDVRAFHDRVLENGALDLPILDQVVKEWIAAESAG